jgi:polyphosphate kinase 2
MCEIKMKKKISKAEYKGKLRELQIELVKLQRHIISHKHKFLIIFEGRDASGKDGVIKRITEHLSPRETRVVALSPPSLRDRESWYFQRYVSCLPCAREMVLFNRSWYNRAGVERVMGYCSESEYKIFLNTVCRFEELLIDHGIQVIKYYLDITKKEQKKRLESRKNDLLKQWKSSEVDAKAQQLWDQYSQARNHMLEHTHSEKCPWVIVNADNKKITRLNIIRDILSRVDCPDKSKHMEMPSADVLLEYNSKYFSDGKLAL